MITYSIKIDINTGLPKTDNFNITNGIIYLTPVEWYNAEYQGYLAWVAAGGTPLDGIPLLTQAPVPNPPTF